MSYPAELLEDDLGGLLGGPRRRPSGFGALGELLAGPDLEGAFLKGQLQSAKTQEAIARARIQRDIQARREAVATQDLSTSGATLNDIILAGAGTDYASAMLGRNRALEFENRQVLADPLADALTKQGAGDAIQGDFKAFVPVGSDAYYSATDPKAGVVPVPAPPDSLAAKKRAPVGYQFRDDGSLEYIPGGPADPAVVRPAPKGYRYDEYGRLVYVPGGPADPVNKVEGFRPTADGSGVEPIPGAPTKVPPVSEGERKAATLATRLENARRRIEALEATNPGVSKPGFAERAALKVGGETAANAMRTPERQQVNAAQLDALDAALTLATGAAYTEVQLEGQRVAYFPQPFDDEATAKAKREAFDVLVALAYEAAGRAAPTIDTALKGQAAKTSKPATATPATTPKAPVRINSPDELAALPSGAEFIAPDGSVRRKP